MLDVDGVLCTRIRGNKGIKPTRACDYSAKGRVKAWFRPHAQEFVQTLLDEDFKVGTWTSASQTHAEPLLIQILGDKIFNSLAVKAYRDLCSKDTEGLKRWDTLKITKNLSERFPEFLENRIILLDDSKSKMRKNHPDLCVLVPSYCESNKEIDYNDDSTLLSLIPKILHIRNTVEIEIEKKDDVEEVVKDLAELKIEEKKVTDTDTSQCAYQTI